MKRRHYILNYIFLIGILFLFLNDHLFKWQFSNWFTGKLSDFIGILIFPMFLAYLFPKKKVIVIIFTGLFFIFWKSPYSQSIINLYNEFALIRISRVVDYTDLIALSVLPIAYVVINKINDFQYLHVNSRKLNSVVIALISGFIFMATTPPRSYFFESTDGNLKFHNATIRLKMNKAEILDKLKQNNINAYLDTLQKYNENDYYNPNNKDSIKGIIVSYYKVDRIIIDNDTISDFQFSIDEYSNKKTVIYINGINISKDIKEDDVTNELNKYYRTILKRYFKNNIKN